MICMFKKNKGISKENTYLLFTESVDKCTYVFVCLKQKKKLYHDYSGLELLVCLTI